MPVIRFSKIIAAFCLSFAAAYSPVSLAGSASGVIINLTFMSDGSVLFSISGTRNDTPSCASATNRFAISSTTALGKTQLAGLLTAYTTGTPIGILGGGSCYDYYDSESIIYFYTLD